jgi:hypothetical protein
MEEGSWRSPQGSGCRGESFYFHRSWINLPWGTLEDDLRYRLTLSYRLVRTSLAKKMQAQLAPFD